MAGRSADMPDTLFWVIAIFLIVAMLELVAPGDAPDDEPPTLNTRGKE